MNFFNKNLKKTDNTAVQLIQIKPTKAWLACSMPCEIRAAEIRNKAVIDIKKGDLERFIYRYLQSKHGSYKAHSEAILCATSGVLYTFLLLCSLVSLKITQTNKFYREYHELSLISVACFFSGVLASAGILLPDLHNEPRYEETELLCMDWLAQQLDETCCKKIQELSYVSKADYYRHTLVLVQAIIEEHRNNLRVIAKI